MQIPDSVAIVDPLTAPVSLHWLAGGGEMSRLLSQKSWAETPLGPIESWPPSLLTTVSLCLAARPAIGEPFERALAGQTSFLENRRMFLERVDLSALVRDVVEKGARFTLVLPLDGAT